MDETSSAPGGPVPRHLPKALAAVFLLVYLLTLNPWAGANTLELLARITERDGEFLFSAPLLYLVTLPLKVLPAGVLPWAANALSALFAALAVATLARCLMLLPHDRTREQRIRGHTEGSPLAIPLAWVPPVFAAALLGLQLTFWEQATSQTGEMLDLLVFAFCVRCLLEYRLSTDENWLWRFAFVYGLGITNNWAMIGFAPGFLIAVIWIRSWSFFNAGFLGRMVLWGCAGLLLYLLTPAIAAVKYSDELSFWAALKALLAGQKMYLLGMPRQRALLLALVSLLPLVFMGVRWGSKKGTSMETMLNVTAVVVLQVGWLIGNVYFAFDQVFSPRKLVHLDPEGGGLPLLTFYFTGALASGYVVGYLLLLATAHPAKNWERPGPLVGGLIKLGFGLSLLGTVALPAALVVRNLPAVRANNGPALGELAKALTASLPKDRSLVVADDNLTYGLATLQAARDPGLPNHVIFHTQRGPKESYRRTLAQRHGADWPELRQLAESSENIAGSFLVFLARNATNNRAFALHPGIGFTAESTWPEPANGIFRLNRYERQQITPPPIAAGPLDATLKWWSSVQPALDQAIAAAELGALNGRAASAVWSRSANAFGAMLQRAGRMEDAGKFFALAVKLNKRNLAAQANVAVNTALRTNVKLNEEARKQLANHNPVDLVAEGGPVEDPVFLVVLGQTLVNSPDRLVRRAAIAFQRALELDPGQRLAALGFAEACLIADQNELALKTVRELNREGLDPAETVRATFSEATALFRLERNAEGEQLVRAALQRTPATPELLDLLSFFYLSVNRYDDAIPLLEQWQRLRQSDPNPSLRLAAIFMGRQQFDRALPLVDTVLKIQPEHVTAQANRAICLLQLNRLDDAKRAYQKLAEKFPDEHIFAYGLAQVAERQKDASAALRHFERYLTLAPTNTLEYGNVAARVGQLKQGR